MRIQKRVIKVGDSGAIILDRIILNSNNIFIGDIIELDIKKVIKEGGKNGKK